MRLECRRQSKHSGPHGLWTETGAGKPRIAHQGLHRRRFGCRSKVDSQRNMKVFGIIPARYGSSRFPGKPLALIAGKPMIQHVVEQCQKAKSLSEVIVATDDTSIWEVAQGFCRAEMTGPNHPSGTDRIAEVAQNCRCDAVVNIQGDEPLIDPRVIDAVAAALAKEEMSTAASAM